MKTIWKSVACRIWLIVTPIVLALIIAVNVLTSVTYYNAVCTVLGGVQMKIVGEELNLYERDYATKADAVAHGNEVSIQVCEEGFTLLKNENALPLLENETQVSVFGKNSVNMAAGGSGSGGGVTAEIDIFDSLTVSGFQYNETLKAFYEDNGRSGEGRDANPSDLDSGKEVTLSEGETPQEKYTAEIWNSCNRYKDVAIIVITRIGGEGFDLPRNEDGTHFLQLSYNEKALIAAVKEFNFGKVILVLNTATTMELADVQADDGIDAVLWTGYAGGTGMTAFGEILRGKTTDGQPLSPSGKTVDTWAADFTHNPTWENFGAALGGDAYTLVVGRGTSQEKVYFVDYEEGIYVGYRYYETAYVEHEKGNYDSFIYENEVVYPFGYGLSYSTFVWELENGDEVNNFVWGKDSSLTFRVKVTNAADGFAARDVVQLYVTPPYTGGIEKSAKVLVGFAKTEVIQPGHSQTVEITVDSPYDFASYDCYDDNGNGFRGYEVEKGTYTFAISTDAHTSVIDVATTVDDDIQYREDPVTGTEVINLYTDNEDGTFDSDAELGSVLSRKNFEETWPQRRISTEKRVASDWIDAIKSVEPNPNRPEQDDEMPATGKSNGLGLSDMIGLDYNDALWSDFMDQMTLSEMTSLINNGAFGTEYILRLGVPPTTASDGPVGFINFMGAPEIYGGCVYPCEVVLSSTWNVQRLYDMGQSVGNEGLVGNEKGDGAPYSGWYAPGLNIHRSPFGGRNFEYYSEDSFLSGKMTAAVMEGCASKGVYVTLKHFALNEQETHRAINGVLTWATEQSMREIYLKGFEIAIKTAKKDGVKAMGVMSSFNRIGTRWTGGDYRLQTQILRAEWGFTGLVVSDFNTCSHMVEEDMFYAGGDLDLQILGVVWRPDANDATDVTVTRQCAKNILYVVANSNAMRGDFVIVLPVWQLIMFIADGVVAVGLLGWGAAVIVRAFRKKSKGTS